MITLTTVENRTEISMQTLLLSVIFLSVAVKKYLLFSLLQQLHSNA